MRYIDEDVHYIVIDNLKNNPVWLNEGLAESYSAFTLMDEEGKIRIGAPISYHFSTFRRSLLPLDKPLAVYHHCSLTDTIARVRLCATPNHRRSFTRGEAVATPKNLEREIKTEVLQAAQRHLGTGF